MYPVTIHNSVQESLSTHFIYIFRLQSPRTPDPEQYHRNGTERTAQRKEFSFFPMIHFLS